MVVHEVVWYPMAWYEVVQHDIGWHGIWHGMPQSGMAWGAMVWEGMIWSGMAFLVQCGVAFGGILWGGITWHNLVSVGMSWYVRYVFFPVNQSSMPTAAYSTCDITKPCIYLFKQIKSSLKQSCFFYLSCFPFTLIELGELPSFNSWISYSESKGFDQNPLCLSTGESGDEGLLIPDFLVALLLGVAFFPFGDFGVLGDLLEYDFCIIHLFLQRKEEYVRISACTVIKNRSQLLELVIIWTWVWFSPRSNLCGEEFKLSVNQGKMKKEPRGELRSHSLDKPCAIQKNPLVLPMLSIDKQNLQGASQRIFTWWVCPLFLEVVIIWWTLERVGKISYKVGQWELGKLPVCRV